MPELPEVEAARLALEEHTKGKLIVRAVVAEDTTVINGVSSLDLQQALTGKRIENVSRKGKNMWLELDERPWPSFQFGMAGAVHIKGVKRAQYKRSAMGDEEWPSKYSKVLVELEDGLEFAFTDTRRFARVRLLDDPKSSPPISELGPDAYLELLSEDEFAASVGSKKGSIKALLLDQSFLAGIGNWVADEVLYQARIHPEQIASSLSKEQCSTLRGAIVKVLQIAIEAGADSSQYPDTWIFHKREKKTGKGSVDGHKIDFIKVGGRTSAYVPELQKLTGPLEDEKPVRKRGSAKQGSEAVAVSKDSPPKVRGKGLKKTRVKVHENTEGDNSSVHQGTDDDEDPSWKDLKKRGKILKGNSAVDEEEEQHSEKECITGVVVATGHHASLYTGGSESVARGPRIACYSKPAWSLGDARQGFGFFRHGTSSCPAAGAPRGFIGKNPSYFVPQACKSISIATCLIRTLPAEKQGVKGGVSFHQGPQLCQSFKACMGILKRPACFV